MLVFLVCSPAVCVQVNKIGAVDLRFPALTAVSPWVEQGSEKLGVQAQTRLCPAPPPTCRPLLHPAPVLPGCIGSGFRGVLGTESRCGGYPCACKYSVSCMSQGGLVCKRLVRPTVGHALGLEPWLVEARRSVVILTAWFDCHHGAVRKQCGNAVCNYKLSQVIGF